MSVAVGDRVRLRANALGSCFSTSTLVLRVTRINGVCSECGGADCLVESDPPGAFMGWECSTDLEPEALDVRGEP